MCTSISMNNGGFCFGRNMDIEFPLETAVVITPRRHPLHFVSCGDRGEHLAYIGAAAVREGVPLYCDGMNEAGLCAAALSFPECVYLRGDEGGKHVIAPFEVIPWVLSQCCDVSQAVALLSETVLADIPFSESVPNTPLHWHFSDGSSALVLECTAEGMKLHHDPTGVLTNSPPFPFHLNNLRQYGHLTARYPENSGWAEGMAPFGRGFGAIGLPGDLSPASRYVRAAFLKLNSPETEQESQRISQLFHILANVAMPRGSVFTQDGREEITAYSCCMSGTRYLFRTYNDSRIRAVDMAREELSGSNLVCYPMEEGNEIVMLN